MLCGARQEHGSLHSQRCQLGLLCLLCVRPHQPMLTPAGFLTVSCGMLPLSERVLGEPCEAALAAMAVWQALYASRAPANTSAH